MYSDICLLLPVRLETGSPAENGNILMGEAPNTPVDSLYNIGMISAPVRILPLEDVLQRRADYASTEVNIMKSQAQRKAALSQFNPQRKKIGRAHV